MKVGMPQSRNNYNIDDPKPSSEGCDIFHLISPRSTTCIPRRILICKHRFSCNEDRWQMPQRWRWETLSEHWWIGLDIPESMLVNTSSFEPTASYLQYGGTATLASWNIRLLTLIFVYCLIWWNYVDIKLEWEIEGDLH
jgi:hypothetical protein